MEARGTVDGERKVITALFADLKGSTALIEGLDPEEARAIIDPALQLMMDAVHRYDGYVAQALGDGIFALFGAPIAHEDHPQRALYAALRMQDEMRRYSDTLRLTGGLPLQMRVGVNTGEVVVRSIRKDDLHTDYVPVGHSTNLAARMEQMATPGSILVTEHTRKLTDGYFDLKALGAAAIKGLDAPLPVYEVLGAGPLRTKLQVAARRGLNFFALVGVEDLASSLQEMLNKAARRLAGVPNVQLKLIPLTLRLPVASRTVDFAYFYHVSEHLEREDAYTILTEIRRCLRRAGQALVQFSLLSHPDNIQEFQKWARRGDPEGVRSRFYTEAEATDFLRMASLFPQLRLYIPGEFVVLVTPQDTRDLGQMPLVRWWGKLA